MEEKLVHWEAFFPFPSRCLLLSFSTESEQDPAFAVKWTPSARSVEMGYSESGEPAPHLTSSLDTLSIGIPLDGTGHLSFATGFS